MRKPEPLNLLFITAVPIIKLFARGEGMVEDMFRVYETRRDEACVCCCLLLPRTEYKAVRGEKRTVEKKRRDMRQRTVEEMCFERQPRVRMGKGVGTTGQWIPAGPRKVEPKTTKKTRKTKSVCVVYWYSIQ
jgi:hypothetical protein